MPRRSWSLRASSASEGSASGPQAEIFVQVGGQKSHQVVLIDKVRETVEDHLALVNLNPSKDVWPGGDEDIRARVHRRVRKVHQELGGNLTPAGAASWAWM